MATINKSTVLALSRVFTLLVFWPEARTLFFLTVFTSSDVNLNTYLQTSDTLLLGVLGTNPLKRVVFGGVKVLNKNITGTSRDVSKGHLSGYTG